MSRKAISRFLLSALLFGAFLLRAEVALQTRTNHVFEADGIEIANDFSGARLNGCERTGERQYLLSIRPENRPVNSSPWYAFRIRSREAVTVELTLDYGGDRHRYRPMVDDGTGWRRLPGDRVAISERRSRALVKLDIGAGWTRVAGQEMIGIEELGDWARGLGGKSSVIGRSMGGREIVGTELGSPEATNLLVVISRQHPPEVTGSIALMSFMERLVEERGFGESFGTLLVPLVNPDGVHEGHWRHNLAGVDVNRDWNGFRQPESRAVRDWILRRVSERNGRVVLFLDFHSTGEDVFYTQKNGAARVMPGFTEDWLKAIAGRMPKYEVRRSASHDPRKGTSKGWAHEVFHCPAITYELGDHTDRSLIRRQALVAAEEMMRLLTESAR